MQEIATRNLPLFVVKSNTFTQIATSVRDIFGMGGGDEELAIREAEEAIERVLEQGEPRELVPRNSYIRRLQHQLVEKYKLVSESIGTEPYRHVRLWKP